LSAGADMRGAGSLRDPKSSKERALGGTMGSPKQDTTVFSRVLYRLSYLARAASV